MPSTKSVAEAENKDIMPVGTVSFEDDAGSGFEEADKDSFAIPFLGIVQKMSPQVDAAEGEYIEGAAPGMLLNSVTQELFDPPLHVVPCHYRRTIVEWWPRDSKDGKGFVAEYDVVHGTEELKNTTRDEKNRDITSRGTQLVDTRSHYVLLVKPDGATEPAVITMTSTQLKKSKRWMTVMQNLQRQRADGTLYNPAMFASVFTLETVPEKNDQGSWHGWKVVHERFLEETDLVDQTLYQTARNFRDAVKSGDAVVQHEMALDEAGTDGVHDDIAF